MAADGRSVAQTIADAAAAENSGETPMGSIGLVVGATIGRTGVDLSQVNGPLLAPGLGAQGATVADLKVVFGDNLSAVLPTTSREVLQKLRPRRWPSCAPAATALAEDLRTGRSVAALSRYTLGR